MFFVRRTGVGQPLNPEGTGVGRDTLAHGYNCTGHRTRIYQDAIAAPRAYRPSLTGDMASACALALIFAVLLAHQGVAADALDGGPGGRGWGGAAADECGLGVSTEHPTKAGFRITMHRWAKGATLKWQFDTPVEMHKHWGPVRPLPQGEGDPATLTFRLKGEKLPSLRGNANNTRRTDQWGFVLSQPFSGRWRTFCTLPTGSSDAHPQHKHGSSTAGIDTTPMITTAPPPSPPVQRPTPSPIPSPSAGTWLASMGMAKLTAAAAAMGLVKSAHASDDDTGRAASGKRGGGKRGRGARKRRRRGQRNRHGRD